MKIFTDIFINYERYSMKKEVQYTKYIGKKLLIANG